MDNDVVSLPANEEKNSFQASTEPKESAVIQSARLLDDGEPPAKKKKIKMPDTVV